MKLALLRSLEKAKVKHWERSVFQRKRFTEEGFATDCLDREFHDSLACEFPNIPFLTILPFGGT